MSWICGRCGVSVRDDMAYCVACAPNAAAHRTGAPGASVGASAPFADVVALKPRSTQRQQKRRSYNDPAFDEFWKHYPLKLDKKKAHQAWTDAIASGAPAQSITNAAMRYARYCAVNAIEPRHIKYAQGWLNGERWNDEIPLPAAAGESDPAFTKGTPEWDARVEAEERRVMQS